LAPRRKRWSIILVSDGQDPVRQLTLSTATLQALGGALALVVLAVLSLTTYALVAGSHDLRARRLARENALLARELDDVRTQVAGLEQTLAALSEKDAEYRRLAGLEATDVEVSQAGVGGPGLASPEAHPLWEVDSVLSKSAFAVEYDLNALERRARILARSLAEAGDSLRAHRDRLEATPSLLPTAGLVSSPFSRSRIHPIYNRALPHEGMDISAPRGSPILAAAKGRVIFAGWKPGYGYTVEIDHGYGYSTLYGHAAKLLVKRGQIVARGQVIAQVGNTGLATSPHLHYEVRIAGRPVNPVNYILAGALP